MGALHFAPRVPVFDANIGAGHRHDALSPCAAAEELLAEMERHGVGRAVVYSLHAETISPVQGNEDLDAWAGGRAAFSLQWMLGAGRDSLEQVQDLHAAGQVQSVRLHAAPAARTPFVDWIYGEALEWLSQERIPLWISLAEVPAVEVVSALGAFPDLVSVLLGAHYSHAALVRPLLRRLPRAHLELSRYEVLGEVEALLGEFGAGRLVYGSFYPRYAMGPVLYYLHHLRCSEAALAALCAGNLERLLARTQKP